MRVCAKCRCAIHPDQVEPRAIVAVYQGGRMRRYSVCGDCCRRLEEQMGRQPYEVTRPALEPAGRP